VIPVEQGYPPRNGPSGKEDKAGDINLKVYPGAQQRDRLVVTAKRAVVTSPSTEFSAVRVTRARWATGRAVRARTALGKLRPRQSEQGSSPGALL